MSQAVVIANLDLTPLPDLNREVLCVFTRGRIIIVVTGNGET